MNSDPLLDSRTACGAMRRLRAWGALLAATLLGVLALGPAAAQGALACGWGETPLTAGDAAAGDALGAAIALSGDWLFVGAPGRDGASPDQGRVYVRRRALAGWTAVQVLEDASPGAPGGFGHAVAADGSTLAVGAPTWTGGAHGAVHVYERSGTSWNPVFSFGDSVPSAELGHAVALDGDVLVAGSPQGGFDAIRIFERAGGAWTLAQTINSVPGAFVDVRGNRVVSAGFQGDVGIFERSGGAWQMVALLPPPVPIAISTGVALGQDEVAVGIMDVLALAPNSVHVSALSGSTWTPAEVLTLGGTLAVHVAFGADHLLLGDVALERAELFERGPAGWTPLQTLVPAGNQADDLQVRAIAIAGVECALGLPDADGAGGPGGPGDGAGRAAVFTPLQPPATYCTAKTNSAGCAPAVSFAGSPGMSETQPFLLGAANVLSQRAGLLVYGVQGPAAVPLFGGFLCAYPPLRRTPLQWSGGSLASDCTGTFALDFNAWAQSGTARELGPGVQVNAQYWYRDPAHPDGTGVGLSDAVELDLCP